MMVRVIGATSDAIRRMRAIAPAGVDIVDEPIAEPDWIVAATPHQRIEAIRSSGLSPYRVLEIPELAAGLDQSHGEVVRTALSKMGGIGPLRSAESPLGVRVAAMVVRRMIEEAPAPVARPLVPIGIGVAGVTTRMPAGPRLDAILKDRALERARRLATNSVRLD